MSAWLFVPGDRPDRFNKALASGADVVVIDLEDAVAPSSKAAARDAAAAWLGADRQAVVRINAPGTPWHEDDLALASRPGVRGLMCPKAEHEDHPARILRAGAQAVWPLVETAAGLSAMDRLARAPGVRQLVFGSLDLVADLGCTEADEDDLLPWRAQMVLASRLAGLEAPIDGVTPAIDDPHRLQADAARARRLGFGAKLCIHPRQVGPVQEALRPSPAQVDWARRVATAAARSGGAAVAVDGAMVDRPVLLRAQALLRRAGLAAEAE